MLQTRKLCLLTCILLLCCQVHGGNNSSTAKQSLQASLEDQVMALLNQERWSNGELPPLKRNELLDNAAESHSSNMATRDFFAHCDLDTGESPWDRIWAAGYPFSDAGENIAAGQTTATWVVSDWMNSSGHRAAILSTSFYEVGIGHANQVTDSYGVRHDSNGDCQADSTNGPWYNYWTLNFGRRSSVFPVVINREATETANRDVTLFIYGASWATEMRIRNGGGTWGDWQPMQSDMAWQLSSGTGVREVVVEIRNQAMTTSAGDTIISNDPGNGLYNDSFESGDMARWSVIVP
jgi:hypothetical protein